VIGKCKQKEGKMIVMETRKKEAERLARRREQLRRRLQKHFTTPVVERDYSEFEKIVDELDDVRRRLSDMKRN